MTPLLATAKGIESVRPLLEEEDENDDELFPDDTSEACD
jgi:hypothetical protein